MSTPWYRRVSNGLTRTRDELTGHLNVLLRRGPDLDAQFWEELEDALIAADMGVPAVTGITDRLRDTAARQALPDANAVLDHLVEQLTIAMQRDGLEPPSLTLIAPQFEDDLPATIKPPRIRITKPKPTRRLDLGSPQS